MDEILVVFNNYKKRVFKRIETRVQEELEESYEDAREVWDGFEESEREEWRKEWGGYGGWWYDWIDDPFGVGIGDYIQDLWDDYWRADAVLNRTLDARVGLDPDELYNELAALVYGLVRKKSGLPEPNKVDEQALFNYINWTTDPLSPSTNFK